MPPETAKNRRAPKRRRAPAASAKADSVTCRHCRYERPAADARCHICGYPWPWLPEPRRNRSKK
jgi:hypothetical protein